MSIKTFRFQHFDTLCEIYLTINTEFQITAYDNTQEEIIKDCVEFWGGWAYRLKNKFNGNYMLDFLHHIAERSFRAGIEHDYNLDGIKNFWTDPPEGYYPLSEIGIEIELWSCPLLDFDELDWDEII